ncbi:family 20 glycosylhydrolase [Olivibacter sitiensis]|uniref:family 20 glycosylhydrolase n=1 Tax=Olivibacter sitiensis TaxID=376470 RepID=UPI0004231953|nr:family 20 glycosylhydrolase [Olivibacter sitiensis]
MKVIIKAICCLLIGSEIVKGQTSNDTLPINVSWQPLENNYLGKERALSVLEIRNNGTTTLPKDGWKLYFNFVRIITPKSANDKLDITHVNGDFFFLSPSSDFEGLRPGEHMRYEMVSNSWLVNRSDAPQGFYLVWNEGEAIQPLGQGEVLAPIDDKKFFRFGRDRETSPEMIYEQNETIRDISERDLPKIFPTPSFYQEGDGAFHIDHQTVIVYDAVFEREATLLNADVAGLLGEKLKTSIVAKDVKNVIRLQKEDALQREAYELVVNPDGINIKAATSAGIFYGMQSLKTLIDPGFYSVQNSRVDVRAVTVKDEPRFGFRALMLDVARNFQPKDQIKKTLDLMALYKLNTLHFHLNDDEGWRLEIPALPELTEVGSKRGHIDQRVHASLPPSYGSGPFVGRSSGSGYYSKSDFIEILRYAADRHIKVIPEIETPGHARAAIKAMEARYQRLVKEGKKEDAEKYLLQDLNDKSTYQSVQKWNDNVTDVSMPSVYRFLEVVTDELIDIYKEAGAALNTIHFGGDEVPNGVWEQSPAYEKLKSEHGSIMATEDLWEYFFNNIYEMLKKKSLYLSGWEEVALRKVSVEGKKKWIPNTDFRNRNIHVNVWNNLLGSEDLAYRLANSGYQVVLSFVTNFYFDMAYHKQFEEPGFYWGGFTELDKPFSFIPFDYLRNQQKDYLGRQLKDSVLSHAEKLSDDGKANIVGIQGLLWSETVKSPDQMEYLILPRFLALAEKAWSRSPQWAEEPDSLKSKQAYEKSLAEFFAIVGRRELKRLDYYAGGFAYRIPVPGLKKKGDYVSANCQLPGFTIRYTTDGSIPTLNSPMYNSPVKVGGNLVFRAFDSRGRGSRISSIQ